MASAQRRLLTPKVYTIGEDISQEQYNALIQAVADWFATSRKTKEPVRLAKQILERCLKGLTPKDGKSPWFSAASSTFDTRVRMACNFDPESMTPMMKASQQRVEKKAKEKEAEKKRKERDGVDKLLPEEMRGKDITYGDDPRGFMTTSEKETWQAYYDTYTKEHPELRGENAQKELELLCDMQVHMDRARMRSLADPKKAPDLRELTGYSEAIGNLKKALSIHPEQLEKRKQKQSNSDIASVVARLESRGDWKAIRAKHFLEEMLMSYQMFHSPRADGNGYQLDEVGLYGLTKCRTCVCPVCKTKNFVGIKVEEIEQYLVKNGVLEPMEPLVQIATRPKQDSVTDPTTDSPATNEDSDVEADTN